MEDMQSMKLIALFRTPGEPEVFDQAYFQTHIPLIKKVPGLLDIQITHFTRTVMGESFYLMATMSFESEADLKAAMRSPEMGAAGKNLDLFAQGLVTLMFAGDR